MAIYEAEPQIDLGTNQNIQTDEVTDDVLASLLHQGGAEAEEIYLRFEELSKKNPQAAIEAYASLADSRDPLVADLVASQLGELLSQPGLQDKELERAIGILKAMLHPLDNNGNRYGDDAAYTAQEAYFLARPSLAEATTAQLDSEIWSEFREDGWPDSEMLAVHKHRESAKAADELRRRGEVRRQLNAEHIARMLDKLSAPYDMAA